MSATPHTSGPISAPHAAQSSNYGSLPCWCGGGEWVECFRTRRFGLLQCPVCGCFRTDPPPLHGNDESASFYTDYYSHVGTDSRPLPSTQERTSWFWRVVEQVPRLAAIRFSAADIGSGDGHFCAELTAAGWPFVVGVEISQTRIARARRFYPQIPFYNCPLSQTAFSKAHSTLSSWTA